MPRISRFDWRPLPVVLAVALSLMGPRAASAQYMYLDSNGDGVHTSADVLNQIGTTQVEIWLRTDHNQDGTTATCPTGEPLTISSYVVCLQASGGTLSFTNASSLLAGFGGQVYNLGTDTEYVLGYVAFSPLPPGTYELAHVTAGVASGAPSLQIVRESSIATVYDVTSFGSACLGQQFDNTMKLGSEWFDVDGLPSGGGGTVNAPPTIPAIPTLSGSVGDVATEDLAITDPNGDPIFVRKGSGPASLYVTGLGAGPGSITARLQSLGRRDEVGSHDASLVAGDGTTESTGPFTIQVSSGPNHAPRISPGGRIDVVAEATARTSLVAVDTDGDPVTFIKKSGPDYASVSTIGSGIGSSAGLLTLRPPLCAVGDALVVVAASDGSATTEISVPVRVFPALPAPPDPVRTFSGSGNASCVAVGDFNEDGHLDVASGDEVSAGARVTVFFGDGTGSLTAGGSYPTDDPSIAIAAGDWNGDGHLDLASGPLRGHTLAILYGAGDGTFGGSVLVPDVTQIFDLAAADLNNDGIADLACVGFTGRIDMLLGSPAGLADRRSIPTPTSSAGVAIADFDRDGYSDVSATLLHGSTVYRGRGDGTFGDPTNVSTVHNPYAIAAGDWNTDGRPDLAIASWDEGKLDVLLGDGTGGFSTPDEYPAPIDVFHVRTLDWNSDGNIDLFVTGDGASALLLGDGVGAFAPLAGAPPVDAYGAAIGDLNEDGRPDLVTSTGSVVRIQLNTTTDPGAAAARAFATASNPTVPSAKSSARIDLRVEPLSGSFQLADVDPATVRLLSDGTGSVSSIAANTVKAGPAGDRDRNGVDEYPASFAASDVAQMFDLVAGKQTLPVHVMGALLDGRRFCAGLSLTVLGTGPKLAASIEPNPFNPSGVLRFTADRRGPVTIRLYDLHGRLVRSIWSARVVDAGEHRIPLDATDGAGRPFASGVYFYRIEAGKSELRGRFTVLK